MTSEKKIAKRVDWFLLFIVEDTTLACISTNMPLHQSLLLGSKKNFALLLVLLAFKHVDGESMHITVLQKLGAVRVL